MFRRAHPQNDIVMDAANSVKWNHCRNQIVLPSLSPKASQLASFKRKFRRMAYARISIPYEASLNAPVHANLALNLIQVSCSVIEKVFQLSSHFTQKLFTSAVTLHQLKDCDCCSVSTMREIPVELVCDDKYKLIKHFNVPSSCSCSKCGADEIKNLKLTAASWKK